MQTISRFEDLQVWQLGREISKLIYEFTRKPSFKTDRRFVAQISASAGSIMDNVAEGFGREGKQEFIQFLYIANGSCCEVQSQLYRAHDVGYITDVEFDKAINLCRTESTKIKNFVEYLKSAEFKGNKYKKPNDTK